MNDSKGLKRKLEILKLKKRKVKLREIIKIYRISRQRIHQILNISYKSSQGVPKDQKTLIKLPICTMCGDGIMEKPKFVKGKKVDYGCFLLFWQKKVVGL